MNILFVCRKFDNVAGGMERMSTAIMNEMESRAHRVGLVTWDHENAIPHYKLSKGVKWLKLNLGNPDEKASWGLRYRRLKNCREYIKINNVDVIIGFQSGGFVFGYISALFLGIPCVAAERVSPDTWKHVRRKIPDRILDTYFLIFASHITVQFQSYVNYYPVILRNKITCIPNPIFPLTSSKKENNSNSKIMLNVGRLCHQKNQQFLIKAFKTVADEFPEWKLVLVGDGQDEKYLKGLTKKLGLEENIIFTGAVKNVFDWYNKAEFFVFPSIFEGFPNALSEALAHGLPSIGFQETFGVNELISDQINGLLTDKSEDAFSEAIKYLIINGKVRRQMSDSARQIVVKYAPENIFNQWDIFFKNIKNK